MEFAGGLLGEYYACKSISVYIIVVQLKLNFYHIIKCNFPTRNSLVIRIYGNLNRYRQAEGQTERGRVKRDRERRETGRGCVWD